MPWQKTYGKDPGSLFPLKSAFTWFLSITSMLQSTLSTEQRAIEENEGQHTQRDFKCHSWVWPSVFNTLSVLPYSPLPLESTPTSYKKERCLDITCTFGICSVHTVIVSKKWRGFKAKLLYRVVYRRSGQTKADITDITTQVHARFHLFLGDKCYHGNQCGYPGNGYYQSVNQTEKCLFGFRQTFTFKLWELVSAEHVTLPCHLFSWMSMLAAA